MKINKVIDDYMRFFLGKHFNTFLRILIQFVDGILCIRDVLDPVSASTAWDLRSARLRSVARATRCHNGGGNCM